MLFPADSAVDVWNIVSKGGVVAVLVLILYGGSKQRPWWVFGWTYQEMLVRLDRMKHDRDRWQEIAVKGIDTAQMAASVLPTESAE